MSLHLNLSLLLLAFSEGLVRFRSVHVNVNRPVSFLHCGAVLGLFGGEEESMGVERGGGGGGDLEGCGVGGWSRMKRIQ